MGGWGRGIRLLALCSICVASPLLAEPAFLEEFQNLAAWESLEFDADIPPTTFELEERNGSQVLAVISDRSASAIVTKASFRLLPGAEISFLWSVANVLKGADGRSKDTDDYALRVYLIFEDPKPSLFSSLVNAVSPRQIPDTAVCYVWSNVGIIGEGFPSPYTERVMNYPLQVESPASQRFLLETRDIESDYRQLFGEAPPALFRIAVMGDTDNTGSKAKGWVERIVLRRAKRLAAEPRTD